MVLDTYSSLGQCIPILMVKVIKFNSKIHKLHPTFIKLISTMKIFIISIANSDYVTVFLSSLTFTSGQSSSNMPTQCIDLVILNDDILEYSNEMFIVQLASWSNKVVITAAGQQAEVVIREDNADSKLHVISRAASWIYLHRDVRVHA